MQTQLFIGGEWRDGASGATIAVTDPATGEHVADVASATPDDATAACQAAHEAQLDWAVTAPRVRAEVLRRSWELMMEHQDELASLIVREQGKPLSDAMGEIAYAAEFFRWNSEEATRIRGTLATAPSGSNRIIVRHPPVGVVVIITPWNFPAAMITRKLAPALAAGNGAVIKPPSETPLTALRIAELLTEAGVPGGLVNVVVAEDHQRIDVSAKSERAPVAATDHGYRPVEYKRERGSNQQRESRCHRTKRVRNRFLNKRGVEAIRSSCLRHLEKAR